MGTRTGTSLRVTRVVAVSPQRAYEAGSVSVVGFRPGGQRASGAPLG